MPRSEVKQVELKREKEFTSNLAESTRTHMEREVQKLVNAAMQETRQRHRDEVNELKEGIRKLKEEAKEQKEEHKRQMEGTKNNFTQKVEQLNSKINDLNQALTALQQQVGAVQAQVAAGAAAAAPAVAPLAAVLQQPLPPHTSSGDNNCRPPWAWPRHVTLPGIR